MISLSDLGIAGIKLSLVCSEKKLANSAKYQLSLNSTIVFFLFDLR